MGITLFGEVPDRSFKVTKIRPNFYNMDERRPVRVSLGCHIEGATLPVPDMQHGPSQLAGMTKRVAAQMPQINRVVFRQFKRFVVRFCKKNFSSLKFQSTETFDFEEWIANAPYPEYRKQELREVYKKSLDGPVVTKVKAFIKDENYPEFKHVRGIYSRDDDYKVRVGPFFQKFGDRLFSTKWFIKKIPVLDRPTALFEKLNKFDNIFCTDFSQFESTFVKKLMNIEKWVYGFFLSDHPLRKHFLDLISKMSETNIIDFKNFTCLLLAKRMSGEMNTSCGNGIMNLLMTMFNLKRAGNKEHEVDGFFEGDDGITGCKILPTAQMYTDLGARIKIEVPESINTASFCGNVFAPAALHNVTNPIEASVSFGWTKATYINAPVKTLKKLLYVKSLSLIYSYPGCPILKHLGLYGLRMTKDVNSKDIKNFVINNVRNSWERDWYMEAIDYHHEFGVPIYEIHSDTRALVSNLYGLSIEFQLFYEKYLDNLTELQPLSFFGLNLPKDWYTYDLEYSVFVPEYTRDINFVKTGYTTPAFLNEVDIVYYNH